MAAMTLTDTIRLVLAHDDVKRNRAVLETEQKQKEQNIRADVEHIITQIQPVLSNAKVKEIAMFLKVGNGEVACFPPYPYHAGNFKNVAVQASKQLIAVMQSPTSYPNAAEAFFRSYNTLIALVNGKQQLLEQLLSTLDRPTTVNDDGFDNAVDFLKNYDFSLSEGKIVLGHETITLSETDRARLNQYGISLSKMNGVPIFLDTEHSSAFISCPDDNTTVERLRNIAKGIFYRNVLTYRPKNLQIAFAERRNDDVGYAFSQITHELKETKTENDDYGIFGSYIYWGFEKGNGKDSNATDISDTRTGFLNLLLSVDEEQRKRSRAFSSLEEYNKDHPLCQKPYILLLIHGLSEMMYNEDQYGNEGKTIVSYLKNILQSGGKYGIFVMFFGENNTVEIGHGEKFRIDTKEYNMQEYRLDDSGYKWVQVSDAECAEIQKQAADNIHNDGKLSVEKMMELTDFQKPEIGVEIAIPMGLSDGEPFYFASSTNEAKSRFHGEPHTMIYGKSGKGKTSLVYTLLLSGGWYYSPDELQFYILDFKSQEGNMDYDKFIEGKEWYIPHVKFISVKGDASFANEVLDMMENLIIRRTEMGCTDYVNYCREGKLPKLPTVYFLIDEYNSIFSGNSTLQSRLKSLTNRCRQAGIHITLIGQHIVVDQGDFGNQYSFGANSYDVFSKGFSDSSTPEMFSKVQAAYRQIGPAPGYVGAYRSAGGDKKIAVVKNAFTENPAALAAKIREKWKAYNIPQQKGGSCDEESADSILQYRESGTFDFPVREYTKGETYHFYIGLSSLESMPIPISFGKRPKLGGEYCNYYVNADVIRQVRIMENAMLSYAEYLRRAVGKSEKPYISFNYFGDWNRTDPFSKKLASETQALVEENNLYDLIRFGFTKMQVLEEIERAYHLYSERQISDFNNEYPYLMCLFNCLWISEFKYIAFSTDSKDTQTSWEDTLSEEEKKVVGNARKKGISDEGIRQMLMTARRMTASTKIAPCANANEIKIDNPEKVLEHLSELMENGATRKVYILLGTENYDALKNKGFCYRSKNESEQIISIPDDEKTPYVCTVHGISTRLYNYHSASNFWKAWKEE